MDGFMRVLNHIPFGEKGLEQLSDKISIQGGNYVT
jgi:hypothetical protein